MKTDNEFIAEFMGAKPTGKTNLSGKEVYEFPFTLEGMSGDGRKFTGYLKFNTSWGWLMPVVEKIGRLEGSSAVKAKELIEPLSIWSDIKDVYFPVVEFIKWYNTQKGTKAN